MEPKAEDLVDFGLSPSMIENIKTFLSLLQKWNGVYNLTAIRDPKMILIKHMMDSLSILPWLKGQRFLDVGTGAGFPGIPIAIARPDAHLVLVDGSGKKTCFLQEVKRVLALSNIEIIQTRIESLVVSSPFDTIFSRAVTDTHQLLDWTSHLLAPQGRWLIMKGKEPKAELLSLKRPYQIESYSLSGLEDKRSCVIIDGL